MKALFAVLALILLHSVARADDRPKKDRAWAEKSAKHRRDVPTAGRRPAKLVNLYNTWTHEWIALEPTAKVPTEVTNRFLRDHYTSASIAMEPKLLGFVLAAATHFRSDTAMIVSGFRHPKFNLILRKKGHQVARDSHHTKGDAVDFYIPKVTTQALHAWAKDQKAGGLGLYLDSGFIHMDTGPIRFWSGE
ncbi:MAG: YcbK family protein [Deltaproteobacteria bacterium]|nr:YcbK family protein [Deltaproteobacteria bacterium]